MNHFYVYAGYIGIGFLAIGLWFYARFLYRAYWLKNQDNLDILNSNLASNLGIPCSAIAAFGLVATLYLAFPAQEKAQTLSIKAFNLEFTGPAGPILLWVVCFLAFVAALKILRRP
ncbi:MAG: hypothetical protein AXA67_10350 [Methylothermaceae bacteria B42]|nr:MAG: hypothetical protein AXA67_10350 [Methylothermaceae bacteria B42]HHJ40531.1 hypothetical protein [Methylothermaceae bacterium]